MTAFSPIVTPHMMVALVPIDAPRFTSVGTHCQSASVWRRPAVVALGWRSLMNETLWPMKTSSSMVTPSQTNVWLDTFTFRPTFACFWISTNVPILELSPISHSYKLTKSKILTLAPSLTSRMLCFGLTFTG
jgi:hypothetical protein